MGELLQFPTKCGCKGFKMCQPVEVVAQNAIDGVSVVRQNGKRFVLDVSIDEGVFTIRPISERRMKVSIRRQNMKLNPGLPQPRLEDYIDAFSTLHFSSTRRITF